MAGARAAALEGVSPMTLDRTEIFDKVCDIAADVLGVEP